VIRPPALARLAVLAAAALSTSAFAYQAQGPLDAFSGVLDARHSVTAHDVVCNVQATQNAALQAANDALCGSLVYFPPGCRVKVATPAAGDPVLEVCSDTTYLFAAGAGIDVETRTCVGGTAAGGPCDDNGDCDSGVCEPDTEEFAETAGTTYTIIGDDGHALSNVAIIDANLWTNQFPTDEPWRACAAATTNAGDTCTQVCLTDIGGVIPKACVSNADCASNGGTCVGANFCGTGHACTAEAPPPSGPGRITPIDLAASTSVTIRGANVWDWRDGVLGIRASSDSLLERNNTTKRRQVGPFGAAEVTDRDTGLWAQNTAVIDNITAAADYGIRLDQALFAGLAALPAREVRGNQVTTGTAGYGIWSDEDDASIHHNAVTGGNVGIGVDGTAPAITDNKIANIAGANARGILVRGGGNGVAGRNTVVMGIPFVESADDLDYGILWDRSTTETDPSQIRIDGNIVGAGGIITASEVWNTTIVDNRLIGGLGTAIEGDKAGLMIEGNYINFTASTLRCRASCANRGSSCTVVTQDTDCGTCGTGSYKCRASGAIQVGGIYEPREYVTHTPHPIIANNLVYTFTTSLAACIRIEAAGKRCGGADVGKPCASSADCAGGAACNDQAVADAHLANNLILDCDIGVDMGSMSSGGGLSASNLTLASNTISPAVNEGVVFPPHAAALTLANILGNTNRSPSPWVNWSWDMGDFKGNTPLPVSMEQPGDYIYRENGEGSTLNHGDVVQVDAGEENAVELADTTDAVVGTILGSCADGASCKVCPVGGLCQVNLVSGHTVIRGDWLRMSATAGDAGDAGGGAGFGVATQSPVSNVVMAQLTPRAITSLSGAPVVYDAGGTPATQFGNLSNTEYDLVNVGATGLSGSKKAVISLTLDATDSGSGTEEMSLILYRATSTCPSVTATGTPTGTALGTFVVKANVNAMKWVGTLQWVDSATVAGTTNYCLTANRNATGTQFWTLNTYKAVVVEYQ